MANTTCQAEFDLVRRLSRMIVVPATKLVFVQPALANAATSSHRDQATRHLATLSSQHRIVALVALSAELDALAPRFPEPAAVRYAVAG
jgi:hypothetical protein